MILACVVNLNHITHLPRNSLMGLGFVVFCVCACLCKTWLCVFTALIGPDQQNQQKWSHMAFLI